MTIYAYMLHHYMPLQNAAFPQMLTRHAIARPSTTNEFNQRARCREKHKVSQAENDLFAWRDAAAINDTSLTQV